MGGYSGVNFGNLKSEVFRNGGGTFWSEIPERGFLENLDKNLLFSQKPACASQIVSHILRMWRLMKFHVQERRSQDEKCNGRGQYCRSVLSIFPIVRPENRNGISCQLTNILMNSRLRCVPYVIWKLRKRATYVCVINTHTEIRKY